MSLPSTEAVAVATTVKDDQPGKDNVQRRTKVRWKLFVLLLVVVAVNYIDRGSISVALPIIQKEFNLPPELIGLLLSAFFWTDARWRQTQRHLDAQEGTRPRCNHS